MITVRLGFLKNHDLMQGYFSENSKCHCKWYLCKSWLGKIEDNEARNMCLG